jgi:hypothetical protein
MSEPLDLEAIDPGWLNPCGPCDLGVPMNCTCPTGDPRIVISQLVTEVERLRAELAARDSHAREQRAAELREQADWLWRRVFLVMRPSPSPLSDVVQRQVMDLRKRADRIEAGDDE